MKKQLLTVAVSSALAFTALLVAAPQADAATGTIVSSVNFRSAPNTSASSYGYIRTGEQVDVIAKVNDWWYKVRDDEGRVGYISTSSKYMKVSGSTSSSTSKSVTTSSATTATDSTALRNKIIEAGKAYLGTPYEYSSSRDNTRTFDCSDFVRQAFKDGAGITLPSDSRSQGDYVRSIGKTSTSWSQLKPGDLMFFMEYRGTSASLYPSDKSGQRITHVGIYLGNGQILHTYSKDSGGVRIDSIAGKSWEARFIFGGSALK
ncbi:C40 family peptidase [Paenibacillus sp. YYML68]|uniref:C40 family peptidase n=1 Tax=Paenibacillus sp. YYML68 TaxID=2909250 RepID=UPI0037C8AD8C